MSDDAHQMAGRTSGATGIATFCRCGRAFWAQDVHTADDRWQAHCDEEVAAGPTETNVLNLRPGDTLVLRYDKQLGPQEHDQLKDRFADLYGDTVKVIVLEGGLRLEGVVSVLPERGAT